MNIVHICAGCNTLIERVEEGVWSEVIKRPFHKPADDIAFARYLDYTKTGNSNFGPHTGCTMMYVYDQLVNGNEINELKLRPLKKDDPLSIELL